MKENIIVKFLTAKGRHYSTNELDAFCLEYFEKEYASCTVDQQLSAVAVHASGFPVWSCRSRRIPDMCGLPRVRVSYRDTAAVVSVQL